MLRKAHESWQDVIEKEQSASEVDERGNREEGTSTWMIKKEESIADWLSKIELVE